jgi:hypothetical protein
MFYGVVEAVHVYGTGGYVRSRQPHIVEFESPLWWKRKPKRITDEEAAEALKEAAKVIKKSSRRTAMASAMVGRDLAEVRKQRLAKAV